MIEPVSDQLPSARESVAALPDRTTAFFNALLTEKIRQFKRVKARVAATS
jgi:hypothetical protein